jgi:rSAM/selenodomain-associated transferase 2
MEDRTCPELSIIVPTFNEERNLPVLLDSLVNQSNLDFELIIVDGGSTDATVPLVDSYKKRVGFPVSLIVTAAGRGRQMNAGFEQAKGISLLFLHADCCFDNPCAIADGMYFLNEEISRRSDETVVGHFALRFMGTDVGISRAYPYYESKARLTRPGCIHGDQGFLVRRSFFSQLGRFDVSLPYLEDEKFVRSVAEQGRWVLLPAEIQTSTRRFEVEGLLQRQILNALILTAAAVGLERFLNEVPSLYRRQGDAGRLDLFPFFLHIKKMLRQMPWRESFRTWYFAGRFMRDNGWQLLLALDVWLGVRRDSAYRGEKTPVLDRFERWYDRLTDHFAGRLLVTIAIWGGFNFGIFVFGLSKKLLSYTKPRDGSHIAGSN